MLDRWLADASTLLPRGRETSAVLAAPALRCDTLPRSRPTHLTQRSEDRNPHMRATIFEEPGKVSVQDRPTPTAGPGEVRLRVAASSLCASDVRVYRGEKYARAGVIPGHEIAGVVDEVGEGVTGVEEGDRVIVCPIVSCGHCRFCQTGKRNRCTSRQTLGYDIDGGFAESVLVPAAIVGLGQVFRVPDDLPLDVAALTEPAACVTASLELCRTGIGDSLFIVGAGPMGLMHVIMARAAGPRPSSSASPSRSVARPRAAGARTSCSTPSVTT